MRLTTAVGAVLVAAGVGVLVAPTGAAGDFGQFTRCDSFRAPWDPRGWVDDGAKIVIGPFGAADVYCASWHGQLAAYQLDPWGNKHSLHQSYGTRFYFWEPATF